MKKVMVVMAAVLAFSCMSVRASLAQETAAADCKRGTQGVWARALAQSVNFNPNSGEEAARLLSAVGIAPPDPGWELAKCMDAALEAHLLADRADAIAAGRVGGTPQGGEAVQKSFDKLDQQNPVSPH